MDKLFAAIVSDDLGTVKALLRADDALATRRIEKEWLFKHGIFHWIYVGDTSTVIHGFFEFLYCRKAIFLLPCNDIGR